MRRTRDRLLSSRDSASSATVATPVVAKIASGLAAILWLLGAPLVVMAGVPFSTDSQYIWMGMVGGLLGGAMAPVVAAYPPPSLNSARIAIRFSGMLTCLGLVATGGLLVLGATGALGQRAPVWVVPAFSLAVIALFFWILLANVAMARPSRLGPLTRALGILAGGSFILSVAASAIFYAMVPNFVETNATVLLSLIPLLLTWLCLPAWLVGVALRLRPSGSHPIEGPRTRGNP